MHKSRPSDSNRGKVKKSLRSDKDFRDFNGVIIEASLGCFANACFAVVQPTLLACARKSKLLRQVSVDFIE